MKVLVTILMALVSSKVFAQKSYEESLKGFSSAGLAYEFTIKGKNAVSLCGFEIAKYVYDSSKRNKSWSEISPNIDKIKGGLPCQSASKNFQLVLNEISRRNSVWIDSVAARLFPKYPEKPSLDEIYPPDFGKSDSNTPTAAQTPSLPQSEGLNCPGNVSNNEMLFVHNKSFLTFGQPAVIDGCDAKELFDGYPGLKEDLNDPAGYCSAMGDCSHIKTMVKDELKLKCRIMTLVTHKDKPSVYDCVVYDLRNKNKRIQNLSELATALTAFNIVVGQ